ncbi:hypothetical protein LZ30DRAFT_378692 [Colletotrichum cereale]|nr:hypothetical protein LZ30DRAFT_378692 [Colletotrichum cereale]
MDITDDRPVGRVNSDHARYDCPVIGQTFASLEDAQVALSTACLNDGFSARISRKKPSAEAPTYQGHRDPEVDGRGLDGGTGDQPGRRDGGGIFGVQLFGIRIRDAVEEDEPVARVGAVDGKYRAAI